MIKNYEDYIYYKKMDRKVLGYENKKIIMPFTAHILKFEILLRRLEYIENCLLKQVGIKTFFFKIYYYINLILFRELSIRLGFTIPTNVFGPGLYIAHYGTIVVNRHCKIGENCWIYPGVNIGANTKGPEDVPILGDNVYIGPGAKLFGKIEIGNNISIGANAVVTKSFPVSNVTLAGVPAKIIKDYNANEKVMMNKKSFN